MKKQITVADPRAFIKFWFEINNQTARKSLRTAAVISTIMLDYRIFYFKFMAKNPNTKLKMLNRIDLADAYEEYVALSLKEELANALVPLACENEEIEPIKSWVLAVTGRQDPRDIAVMAHWCWMVKRKGFGLPVKHQIMPVVYGPQGGGKTVALESLIKPIQDYRLVIGMDALGDSRVFDGLANNYVVLFDELQGIERTDMNSLKKQITTNYNSYRRLHSHTVLNVPMLCSFIGATNKPLNESFSDSTGMRRFWELIAVPKLDWKAVSDIDYTELWKGIDEKLEDGYLVGTILASVGTEQNALVNHDDLDIFMQENLIRPEEENDTKKILNDELYTAYVHWAGRKGITSKLNAIWFGRKMKRRLPTIVENKKTFYIINESGIVDSRSH